MTVYEPDNLLMLKELTVRNFKAVRDSGNIKLKPFNVLVGSNGSGKSSLVEALQTHQAIVLGGLSKCFAEGIPFEDLLNNRAKRMNQSAKESSAEEEDSDPQQGATEKMEFQFLAWLGELEARWDMGIEAPETFDELKIVSEKIDVVEQREDGNRVLIDRNDMKNPNDEFSYLTNFEDGFIVAHKGKLGKPLYHYIAGWSFITLNPEQMKIPVPLTLAKKQITMQNDGRNMAEYLLQIKKQDLQAFNRIIETVQLAIPYIKDIQPALTQEHKRKVYLNMVEESSKIASWLLSTGTLRFVALLAMLHAPSPPSLIVIDEIENGLDPCSLSILINEIRSATENGITQVIATTHSPYLLDLLDLSDIIMAERNEDNCPVFWRPDSQKDLSVWAEKFAPGELYRMDRLKKS